jgi:hypothetical protein
MGPYDNGANDVDFLWKMFRILGARRTAALLRAIVNDDPGIGISRGEYVKEHCAALAVLSLPRNIRTGTYAGP